MATIVSQSGRSFAAGKALDERKAEVRIQFKEVPTNIFEGDTIRRNELVVRIQPNEAIWLNVVNKKCVHRPFYAKVCQY